MIKKINVEVADTDQKRSMGLMFRKTLDENDGMLFKFKKPDRLSFWMQNTYLPLDIAFLDNDGRIMQISEMYPLSTRMVSSDQKCQFALEVNKGWFSRNGIRVGDKINNIESVFGPIKTVKMAQVQQNEDMLLDPTIPDPNTPNPNSQPENPEESINPEQTQSQQPEEQDKQQQALQNPNVQVNRSYRDTIEYASNHDLPLMIIYKTMEGNVIGPRKFLPINHKYKIETGPSGEHLVAYDASANIDRGGMEIEGGTIKTPLIKNIINIQVIEETPPPQKA